jgi:hypothetical protein
MKTEVVTSLNFPTAACVAHSLRQLDNILDMFDGSVRVILYIKICIFTGFSCQSSALSDTGDSFSEYSDSAQMPDILAGYALLSDH